MCLITVGILLCLWGIFSRIVLEFMWNTKLYRVLFVLAVLRSCRILVTQLRTEPRPWQWECQVWPLACREFLSTNIYIYFFFSCSRLLQQLATQWCWWTKQRTSWQNLERELRKVFGKWPRRSLQKTPRWFFVISIFNTSSLTTSHLWGGSGLCLLFKCLNWNLRPIKQTWL